MNRRLFATPHSSITSLWPFAEIDAIAQPNVPRRLDTTPLPYWIHLPQSASLDPCNRGSDLQGDGGVKHVEPILEWRFFLLHAKQNKRDHTKSWLE